MISLSTESGGFVVPPSERSPGRQLRWVILALQIVLGGLGALSAYLEDVVSVVGGALTGLSLPGLAWLGPLLLAGLVTVVFAVLQIAWTRWLQWVSLLLGALWVVHAIFISRLSGESGTLLRLVVGALGLISAALQGVRLIARAKSAAAGQQGLS